MKRSISGFAEGPLGRWFLGGKEYWQVLGMDSRREVLIVLDNSLSDDGNFAFRNALTYTTN